MLTKQLQVLIDTGLANGQSYDEIGGMLSLQKFSDDDISQLFSEYEAQFEVAKTQQQTAAPPVQTQSVVEPQIKATPATPQTAPSETITKSSQTIIDLDDDVDISFVEEEAAENAEYNTKTPSYLDKDTYEQQAVNASVVSDTIRKPVEQEIFDIDEDMKEDVAIPAIQNTPPVPPKPTSVPVAPPVNPTPPQQPQTQATQNSAIPQTPSVAVVNNVPRQSQPQTSHVATQPQPTTQNLTQFGSTLTTSCVGSDFTGSSDVNDSIMKTKSTTQPQLGWNNPAMQQQQQQSVSVQQQSPIASQPLNQQTYVAPQAQVPYQTSQSVQVGLGGIPELTAASQFAEQQQKGKSMAPLIIVLVIVLGMIFGFMYWYYFISDLSGSKEIIKADVSEVVPQEEVERDPFSGAPVR
jgi:hypothetical protein